MQLETQVHLHIKQKYMGFGEVSNRAEGLKELSASMQSLEELQTREGTWGTWRYPAGS